MCHIKVEEIQELGNCLIKLGHCIDTDSSFEMEFIRFIRFLHEMYNFCNGFFRNPRQVILQLPDRFGCIVIGKIVRDTI